MRKATVIAGRSLGAWFWLATGCDKLKSRDAPEPGRRGLQERQIQRCGEHFKQAARAGSGQSRTRAVSGHRVHVAVDSGRRIAGEPAICCEGQGRIREGAREEPERRRRRSLRWPRLPTIRPPRCRRIRSCRSLDEAAEWYKKLIEVDPKNKEAYYSLGVIAWVEVVSGAADARASTFT